MSEEIGHLSTVEDEATKKFEGGIALCLSGGGYRAMIFHLGALWRLNELKYLKRISLVSSVSGGAITASVLASNWQQLDFDSEGVSRSFVEVCVNPVREMASITIDLPSIIAGILGPGSVNKRIIKAYRKHLFKKKTLQDLPSDTEGPIFVINATNVQSGVLCRFSKECIGDYRVGFFYKPEEIEIAQAVAASSAFPPVLSPAVFHFNENDFKPGRWSDLNRPPFTTRMFLTDGGVYDNLGLENVFKIEEIIDQIIKRNKNNNSYKHEGPRKIILVSDGGGRLQSEEKPARTWVRHLRRIISVIDRQVRSLRYRELMAAYETGTISGAYWGTHTNIQDYKVPTPLNCPIEKTTVLAQIETRLKKMPSLTQEKLINWGYAVCDAALRAYVDKSIKPPIEFPYPDSPVA